MKKLLLVDDEHIIRQALNKNLKKSGYDVTAAASGDEALGFLKEHSFDIVVTDYLMAGLNGIDLTTKAKNIYPSIKVIMFSGHMKQNITTNGTGADCFLSKPISLDELLETIERLLKS